MPGSPRIRSGEVEYDGKFIWPISSGRLVNAASAVSGVAFTAPFDGTIVDYHAQIPTQFTHADAALAMGLITDSDSNLDDYDLTSSFTGYRNLIGLPDGAGGWIATTGKQVTKGLAYYTAQLAASDTTGVICATVVVTPR